jgi:hypothetical protein
MYVLLNTSQNLLPNYLLNRHKLCHKEVHVHNIWICNTRRQKCETLYHSIKWCFLDEPLPQQYVQ